MEQKREPNFFSKIIDVFFKAVELNEVETFLATSTDFQEMKKAAGSSMVVEDMKLVSSLSKATTFFALLDLTEKYTNDFEKQPILELVATRFFSALSNSFSQTASFSSHVISFKKELQLHMLRNDYSLTKTKTNCQ